MSLLEVEASRRQFAEYAKCQQRLVDALESDADSEDLHQLSLRSSRAFETARSGLEALTEDERKSLTAELAPARRWSGLAENATLRAQADVSQRMADLNHTRQILAHLDDRPTGESCDIAG
ncbi:MAG TPA: hypothetical protein VK509_13865 [Polyangiales bacterium]|nr:hypothetical protein [Polyangiales bacterium]